MKDKTEEETNAEKMFYLKSFYLTMTIFLLIVAFIKIDLIYEDYKSEKDFKEMVLNVDTTPQLGGNLDTNYNDLVNKRDEMYNSLTEEQKAVYNEMYDNITREPKQIGIGGNNPEVVVMGINTPEGFVYRRGVVIQ